MLQKLIRAWLALTIAAAPICQARAACSLDGNQTLGTGFTPTINIRTFPIATAFPNDEIVLFISINAETDLSFPHPSVVSITSPGLLWNLRGSATTGSIPACYGPGAKTCYVDAEEWVATAINPISTTFTITVNSDPSISIINVFGVHGSGGFDTNLALPTVNSALVNTPSTVDVPGVSTTQFPDMALFTCNAFFGAYGGGACGGTSTTPPWKRINGTWEGNLFTGYSVQTATFQQPLVGSVSGVTFQAFPNMSAGWIAQADALTCSGGSGSAFPQVQILD